MKNKMLSIVICSLLAGCATGCAAHRLRGNAGASYTSTCTKTENHGEIDAYEVLNINKKTTFKADEYIKCKDGRNVVVIKWDGPHDKRNADLAAQVMTKFFTHFHAGEHIEYLLVPEESSENLFVYKFEHYTPQRTIRSF